MCVHIDNFRTSEEECAGIEREGVESARAKSLVSK